MITKHRPNRPSEVFWQFALGVGATLVAFILRTLLDAQLVDNRPYITFYLSVVVAARYGGAWSGMLATILGGLLGLHFFSEGPAGLGTPVARLDYGLYFIICLVITLAFETSRREKATVAQYAEALEESQGRLQTLLDNSPTGIYLKDTEGRYLLINKEYARVLGVEPQLAIGQTDNTLVAAPIAEYLRKNDLAVLMTGAPVSIEKTLVVGGERRHFISTKFPLLDAQGWPIAVGSISIDVTDRKRLEEQLLHTQKMESIGRLAGGIAHDFNNLLTAIIGYAELAEMRIDPAHPVAADLVQIRSAGERAAKLTAQLLAFARKQVQEKQVINLNAQAERIHQLLDRLVGDEIRLNLALEPKLWRVEADAGQVDQVIVNLVVNARDAIEGGGEITIETRNVVVETPLKAVDGDVERGEYVLLSVKDGGAGIGPQTLENIFEPFFTTKESGRGTGLGLATVYGIVRQHDGQLSVDSEVGVGSSFNVYLPRSEAISRNPPQAGEAGLTGQVNGTILLLEEDDELRSLALETLQDLGYRTLLAENAQDAIEFSRGLPGEIDLLVVGPDAAPLTAHELEEELTAAQPQMKVLVVGMGILLKPYTSAQLAAAVRRSLANQTIIEA
ncbi:MAG: PAS domain-containing protein [Armatimonadota bacterium]|nr:PAS domain-containing protein [Armatimonadota bacterium]